MANEHTPPTEPTYDIGYGKPPKKNQFKKGKSGNPGGRPKASAQTPDLAELLDPPVNIIEKGKKRTIRAFEAQLRDQAQKGIGEGLETELFDLIDTFIEYGMIVPMPPQTESTTIHVPEIIWAETMTALDPDYFKGVE